MNCVHDLYGVVIHDYSLEEEQAVLDSSFHYNAAYSAAFGAESHWGIGKFSPFWILIRTDLYALESGQDILTKNLFSNEANNKEVKEAVETLCLSPLNKFKEHALVKNTHWEIISDCYEHMIKSHFERTPWGRLGGEKDVVFALKANDFWDRDPDLVMSEIAEVVGWRSNRQSDIHVSRHITNNPALNKLMDHQVENALAIQEEFPNSANIYELNRYLTELKKGSEKIDFSRLNEQWARCQGNRLFLHFENKRHKYQAELSIGFDQAHYAIMQFSADEQYSELFEEVVDNEFDNAARSIQSSIDNNLGFSFSMGENFFEVNLLVGAEDEAIISSSDFQLLRAELQDNVEEFIGASIRLGNKYGWSRAQERAERLLENITKGEAHLKVNCRQIWADLSYFTSCWERDGRVSRKPRSLLVDALDPDDLHSLEQIVVVGNPWIREIPSIRALDEEAINFRRKAEVQIAPTSAIAYSAYAANVIGPDEKLLFDEFEEVYKNGGSQAGKAEAVVHSSQQNLVRAVFKFVVITGGFVGTNFASWALPQFGNYAGIREFLISSWPMIQTLFSAHAAELAAYEIVIKRIYQTAKGKLTI